VASSVDLERADIRCYEQIAPIVRGADVYSMKPPSLRCRARSTKPLSSHEVNIDGAFHVLRACADGGVKRVVYAASSSAYGDTAVLPKVETMLPSPRSPYALAKAGGRVFTPVCFSLCFGLETVALRYFNVFGPGRTPQPILGRAVVFMKRLLERRAPTIFGTVSNPAISRSSRMWWI